MGSYCTPRVALHPAFTPSNRRACMRAFAEHSITFTRLPRAGGMQECSPARPLQARPHADAPVSLAHIFPHRTPDTTRPSTSASQQHSGPEHVTPSHPPLPPSTGGALPGARVHAAALPAVPGSRSRLVRRVGRRCSRHLGTGTIRIARCWTPTLIRRLKRSDGLRCG